MGKVILVLVIVADLGIGWVLGRYSRPPEIKTPIINPRTLDKYTIENLSKRGGIQSEIVLDRILYKTKDFTSYLFFFTTEHKKVSGQINLPKDSNNFPIIVMFRGYIDQQKYTIGMGTKSASEFFAKNGFITIAPDFFGYGESDQEARNIFEARFQTYTTALDLIVSVNSVSQWNQKDIFIWGHSNGGQIALTILEATGVEYPTVLWAPVSKPFPYSILYYTDESEDKGKLIRRELAKFEELYDPDLYSIHKYYDRIKAPIQIHQGKSDNAVPKHWSDELSKTLLNLNLPAGRQGFYYYIYPNADHNLTPDWNKAVTRDIEFFEKHL